MPERKTGELVSLADKMKAKQTREIAELPDPPTPELLKYLLEEYFSDEKGQEKIMRALDKKISDQTDREDILNVIDEMLLEAGYDDSLAEEAEIFENEFGLVNILCGLAKKSKEQNVTEFNEALASGMKKMDAKAAEEKNQPAKVYKFSK